jgi:MFS family permease
VSGPQVEVDTAQRKVVATLIVTQALGGIGVATGLAVSSLLAADIVDDETLSGLPQTSQVVGAALMAIVLARIMDVRGRRPGLAVGYVAAMVGSLLCVVAAVVESFPLLLVGALLIGSATAVNNQSRYAATDLASPSRRARALSIVVWATTLGAVLGPNLVGVAGRAAEAAGLPELSGPFVLGFLGLAGASAVMTIFLRPDPLLLARERAGISTGAGSGLEADAHGRGTASSPARPGRRTRDVWKVLAARPHALAAVAAMAAAHTVMVSVMVMTPLHMHHGDAELDIIGFVISMHILGMFAFSPVVGWLTDRVGRPVVLVLGAVTLVASVLLAGSTSAGASTQLTIGLFLLGLGWSFALIASSALLVDAVPLADRPAAQGASDLVMGLAAAAGGALAGVVVDVWGYDLLNVAAGLLAVVVLAAAVVARGSSGEGQVGVEPAGVAAAESTGSTD